MTVMKTTALRIYGKGDLRLETFELPAMGEDEILAEVTSNSVCMSSHKAALLGGDHKRVPDNVAENPTIIGHEFAGTILEVGRKWADRFEPGERFSIQPAMEYKGSLDAPGYSFPYIGGMATHILIPGCVMESDCLLPYDGAGFFKASLSEPMSCIVGAVHAQYHPVHATHEHQRGIVGGGRCVILAGAGPMGLGCVDYLLHGPQQPGLLVVTDIDGARLARAAEIIGEREAARCGVRLLYVNTGGAQDAVKLLEDISGGQGYDDVFVYAPVAALVEQADAILARNGCLNFFAGPTDKNLTAKLNLFNIHYGGTHIVGTSGGNTNDMRESLALMAAGKVNPAAMITHIGGLTAARQTILGLPGIAGGKKLIYTHLDLPLSALSDFEELGRTDPLYRRLAELCAGSNGVWNTEAEEYLLANTPRVSAGPARFRAR